MMKGERKEMRKIDIRLIDLRLVKKMICWWASTTYEALRYSDYSGDYEDLVQDGIVVFLEALNAYDPTRVGKQGKRCKFSSFLYRLLMNEAKNRKKKIMIKRKRLGEVFDACEYLFAVDRKGKERSQEFNYEEIGRIIV